MQSHYLGNSDGLPEVEQRFGPPRLLVFMINMEEKGGSQPVEIHRRATLPFLKGHPRPLTLSLHRARRRRVIVVRRGQLQLGDGGGPNGVSQDVGLEIISVAGQRGHDLLDRDDGPHREQTQAVYA